MNFMIGPLPKWALAALGLAGVVLDWWLHQSVVALPPGILSLLTIALTALGMFTPSSHPALNARAASQYAAKAAQRGVSELGAVMALSIAVVLGALVIACPQLAPAVTPVLDCTECVSTAAMQGESLVQIFADCGRRCGNDAAQILEILLSSTSEEVHRSKAFIEATRARARISAGACK